MAHHELVIGNLTDACRLRDAPEGMVYKAALSFMAGSLSNMLTEGTLDAALIPNRLHDDLAQNGIDYLIPNALREEREWNYVGTVLHQALGLEPPEEPTSYGDSIKYWQGPVDAPMPEMFKESLLGQVKDLDLNFDVLEGMHSAFANTKILGLMQAIKSLGLGTSEQVENPTDAVYEWVEDALFNPEFTLPDEDAEALYLLCFAPRYIRKMIKGVLGSNQIIAAMSTKLGTIDEDEKEMLGAIKSALKVNALTGQEWTEFGNEYGVSEDVSVKMALLSADHLTALATIERLHNEQKAPRVTEAYKLVKDDLYARIGVLNNNSELCLLANTDIGHGFKGFTDYDINRCLKEKNEYDRASIQKNGRHAVIFEDDDTQRSKWQETINGHTPYCADEGDLYSTFGSISERFDDMSIGLFLVDIQNREDDTAGIRLAEAILRKRLQLLGESEFDSKFPHTKIVLWSSSHRHVEQAVEHFKALIGYDAGDKKIPGSDRIDQSMAGSGRSQGGRIKFEIRPKLWNPSSDIRV